MSVGHLGYMMLGCVRVLARDAGGRRGGVLVVLSWLWVFRVLWVLGLAAVHMTELLTVSAAPEVVKGDPVGSAADVWGVGVLTYIM